MATGFANIECDSILARHVVYLGAVSLLSGLGDPDPADPLLAAALPGSLYASPQGRQWMKRMGTVEAPLGGPWEELATIQEVVRQAIEGASKAAVDVAEAAVKAAVVNVAAEVEGKVRRAVFATVQATVEAAMKEPVAAMRGHVVACVHDAVEAEMGRVDGQIEALQGALSLVTSPPAPPVPPLPEAPPKPRRARG